MDLSAAFRRALPQPDWPARAWTGAIAALFRLEDWRGWLDEAHALLDPAEVVRVAQRRFAAHREALTLSYALHRLLLAETIGCGPQAVPLSRDRLGCPRLDGAGLWTSLSHGDDAAAVAIGAVGPVGIDLEPVARAEGMAEIAERVCHSSEAAALADLEAGAYGQALLDLWVRKEALLKAAGVGLACDMDGFAAPEGMPLPLFPDDPAATARVELRMLEAGLAHRAALAVRPGTLVAQAWLRGTLLPDA